MAESHQHALGAQAGGSRKMDGDRDEGRGGGRGEEEEGKGGGADGIGEIERGFGRLRLVGT